VISTACCCGPDRQPCNSWDSSSASRSTGACFRCDNRRWPPRSVVESRPDRYLAASTTRAALCEPAGNAVRLSEIEWRVRPACRQKCAQRHGDRVDDAFARTQVARSSSRCQLPRCAPARAALNVQINKTDQNDASMGLGREITDVNGFAINSRRLCRIESAARVMAACSYSSIGNQKAKPLRS